MQLKRLEKCRKCGEKLNGKRYFYCSDYHEQTYNFQRREVEKSRLQEELAVV